MAADGGGEEKEKTSVAGEIGDEEVNAEGDGDEKLADWVGDEKVAERVGDEQVTEKVGDEQVAEGDEDVDHVAGGGGDQGDQGTS